ncbi:MAG: ABC transporter permease [Coriobacteriia bacterium]|nr:ABC transporter permease [Coriobacteriia bacterium]MBS5479371.1 ABC transporter permease [Coriobacteriia bacterium]
MSSQQTPAITAEAPKPAKASKTGKRKVALWRRSPSLIVGAAIVLLACVVAAFPQLFTSQNPLQINPAAMLQPPSAEHLFGTDNFGYDVFTRVIYATRLDLLIGVGSVALPFVLGSLLGLLAGYYGGKFDTFIMRVLDIFMAFPFMVLAIAIVAILGNGVSNLLIAMWIVSWPPYTRLVRSEVLVAKNSEYVQAAKTLGYSDATIIFRHILPNVISSSVVYGASDIVMCIMTAASLSFLGMGVPAPTPEWGAIISAGKGFISTAWWITALPGLVMVVVGLGFSLLGDGLNDLLRTKD